MVRKLVVPLRRVRCPKCGSSFADYPPFLAAHKQYALPELFLRVKSYVEKDGMSYRLGVTETGLPIFHDEEMQDPGRITDEDSSGLPSILSHSTLYRWVTTLGLAGSGDGAGRPKKISPRKYRTVARRRELASCLAVVVRPWFMIAPFPSPVHRLCNRSTESDC